MKILLLGPNGQVGWELQRSLAPLGEVVTLGRGEAGGDLADLDGLSAAVRRIAPEVIVNAAAWTAVDQAEHQPEAARQVNARAPARLADEARALDALLVHYSTDYVFDGSGETPWLEDDVTGPLNVYGLTKLEGEQAIRESGCRHLLFRTSWVYAARGKNFLRTMMRLAAEREALKVVDDQHGAPTSAELIADVSAHALTLWARSGDTGGTFHLVAGGVATWHGFASYAIDEARQAGLPIRVRPDAIARCPSSEFPTPARRPANSRLDTTRLRRTFGLTLPEWKLGVARAVRELAGS